VLTHLTQTLTTLITNLYVTTGLVGIIIAMAIESCCIPLPSELVMPIAGIMIIQGKLLSGTNSIVAVLIVAVVGSIGCLIGSIAAYWIGYAGGRPLMLKYGRYVLISQHDAEKADYFFNRWGGITTFFSRLLPVIRTYISLPAGIAKMPFWRFCVYTILGSLPWCFVLAYIGTVIGNNLGALSPIFHYLDIVIVAAVIILVVLYIWRHIKNDREARTAQATSQNTTLRPGQPQFPSQQAWNQPSTPFQQPPQPPQLPDWARPPAQFQQPAQSPQRQGQQPPQPLQPWYPQQGENDQTARRN
jgi:membrane protein DedA with SNARE-associated domain